MPKALKRLVDQQHYSNLGCNVGVNAEGFETNDILIYTQEQY
jgi:hypothetical protein